MQQYQITSSQISYEHDEAGRLLAFVNENAAQTTFQYDAMDRLIEQINFDNRTQRYNYDAAGQLLESEDAGSSYYNGVGTTVGVAPYMKFTVFQSAGPDAASCSESTPIPNMTVGDMFNEMGVMSGN